MRFPCCCSTSSVSWCSMGLQRAAGRAAAQSAGACWRRARPRLQYGRQLRDQHELAVLCRRNDHELPLADAGLGGAELRVRRHRHRAGGGADPWLCPPVGAGHRQFLGRSDALHALHPAADIVRGRPFSGLAGHAPEFQCLCDRDNGRGRPADDRARPGCVADRHQDARHQRRRLLQRQCSPSLRKSDSDQQFAADGADLRHRRRPHQRLRPHGGRPAPGLGRVRRPWA